MNDLHPHWQATDDGESVPVRVTPPPVALANVSRRPAAIVGILFALSIGLVFFQGIERSPAQIAASVEVRITAQGLEPASISVRAGQDIVWRNEQEIPHIIQSDELCTTQGDCLFTNTMFQGDTAVFTVTSAVRPGTYRYFSATAADIAGEVIVTDDAAGAPSGEAPAPQPETEPAAETPVPMLLETAKEPSALAMPGAEPSPAPTTEPEEMTPTPAPSPVVTDGAAFTVAAGAEEAAAPAPSATIAAIPRNPYTLESGRIHPYGPTGEPIEDFLAGDETLRGAAPRYGIQTERALRQPETGPSVWIASLLSLAAFWWLMRRRFARVSA